MQQCAYEQDSSICPRLGNIVGAGAGFLIGVGFYIFIDVIPYNGKTAGAWRRFAHLRQAPVPFYYTIYQKIISFLSFNYKFLFVYVTMKWLILESEIKCF